MPAVSGPLTRPTEKFFGPIANRLHFFRVERKTRRKKDAPDIEKIFNSPFQISLQEKRIRKNFLSPRFNLTGLSSGVSNTHPFP